MTQGLVNGVLNENSCWQFEWFSIGYGFRETKDFKMVLDTSLLNTQQYKVRIKAKVEKSKERYSILSYILV